MTPHFKITQALRAKVLADLDRPHSFAAERVGFLSCRVASSPNSGLLILAEAFHSVADEDYLPDPRVGAMMGEAAIRSALQLAYSSECSMFHVHCHDHRGVPTLSKTDVRETAQFVPDFFNAQPCLPHGALVLSRDSATGFCWLSKDSQPVPLTKISFVGSPLKLI